MAPDKTIHLRRLALARAVLSLIASADDQKAVLSIVTGNRSAIRYGGLSCEQLSGFPKLFCSGEPDALSVADAIGNIILTNHGVSRPAAASEAASVDILRVIRIVASEAKIGGFENLRELEGRIDRIMEVVRPVVSLLAPDDQLSLPLEHVFA